MHLPAPLRPVTLTALGLLLFLAGSLRAEVEGAEAADAAEAAVTEPAPDLPKSSPETIAKAVEARRGKTELSKLAASMESGTWAELKHEMPKGIWSAPKPSKGLHIGTWSDDGHWDSRTGQFVYFGVRQNRKLIAYSEETNTWRNIPFEGKPNAPELHQQFGHQYSNNSYDPERSCYYTGTYRYDIANDTWARLPRCTVGEKFMTWEYFSAMDGLLGVARVPQGGLCFYSTGKKTWTKLGVTPVHGYHSIARHNPIKKEVLLAGGNDCRAVVIVKPDGTTTRMKDFPLAIDKFTIRSTAITLDPLTGRYLMMVPERTFVEFDSETNEYRLIDDFTKTPWPFYKYDGKVAAFIPEYGVTFWADAQKVHLYKHKPCTGEPLKPAPSGATADAASKDKAKGEEK